MPRTKEQAAAAAARKAKTVTKKQAAEAAARKKTERFNFLTTPAVARRIEKAAFDSGKAVSVWVREAVERALEAET